MQKIIKPWGYELIWAMTNEYIGKVLVIYKNHQLSLQYHVHKKESIFLEQGKLLFILEDHNGILQEHVLYPEHHFLILPNKKHRMIALEDSRVFEVSTPHLSDVIRLDDAYGRI